MKISYYGKLLEELKLTSREETINTSPMILTEHDVPNLTSILNFLNNKDKDILFLIFISDKTQTDIVHILRRSQPSLSYDIGRIKKRIRFICYLHSFFPQFIEWLTQRSGHYNSEQVMVFTMMYFTTSFSQSSRVSGLKPTRIRYIFDKTLIQFKNDGEEEMFTLFSHIRKHLNTVRREYLRASRYWGEGESS
jgi:hypothetical protein